MQFSKILILFIFLSAFAIQVSAQNDKQILVWKNLQEKYENFEDIKPIIVNVSEIPIYFDCNLENFEETNLQRYVEQSDNTKLLFFDGERNIWDWNVIVCGTVSNEERVALKKKYKEIENLQKEGKYIPTGCKINPNEEYALNFNSVQWKKLIHGDGSRRTYKSGKFKFAINYWWFTSYKNSGSHIVESTVFEVVPN